MNEYLALLMSVVLGWLIRHRYYDFTCSTARKMKRAFLAFYEEIKRDC